ncbi:MAG: replication-associated recombination protein A, partial [Myxococcota bacterium]|nr:replication-associated recombination protein A [Myxococcota bacterium]
LVAAAGGDARRLYSILEVAADLAARSAAPDGRIPGDGPDDGPPPAATLTADHVAEAAQGRNLLYDKAGDEHYGVVSVFIKSMRGSDPDAAVYWMTRMIEAGEDPRFVLRRMVIFASEDVGNADPQALVIATAALQACELVGLPEGVLPLTQAVVYLALAPKSNRALTTYAAARKLVRERGTLPVPARFRPGATATDRAMGHGQNYKYPHDFEGHYVPEDYLPDALVGEQIYEPCDSGFEAELGRRRAAILEKKQAGS